MLPERLTEGHPHLIAAGATADVLVLVQGFDTPAIGRYFHEIDEWQVNGWTGQPTVEEWWPLPQAGTGNKSNDYGTCNNDERPLLGEWRHSNNYVCCGSMRIFRTDIDTNPSEQYTNTLLDWIVNTLNKGGI